MLADAKHPDDIMRAQLQIQTMLQQIEGLNYWTSKLTGQGKRK